MDEDWSRGGSVQSGQTEDATEDAQRRTSTVGGPWEWWRRGKGELCHFLFFLSCFFKAISKLEEMHRCQSTVLPASHAQALTRSRKSAFKCLEAMLMSEVEQEMPPFLWLLWRYITRLSSCAAAWRANPERREEEREESKNVEGYKQH